jgi:hypothetical protein
MYGWLQYRRVYDIVPNDEVLVKTFVGLRFTKFKVLKLGEMLSENP